MEEVTTLCIAFNWGAILSTNIKHVINAKGRILRERLWIFHVLLLLDVVCANNNFTRM